MRKLKVLILGVVFVSVMVLSTVGWAAPVTFDLTYEGISGSTATGNGFITFDDAILPNPGDVLFEPTLTAGVLDFSLTIMGASAGNGTFDLTDITLWFWVTGPAVDLTIEIVGQVGFHDFNFMGATPGSPFADEASRIRTRDEEFEFADTLELTAMTPRPVPTPSAFLLMGTGLLGLIGYRKWSTNKS